MQSFANLMLLSAPRFLPQLYGGKVKAILEKMFVRNRNLFSYCHTLFAMSSEEKTGMLLSYSWRVKKREDLRTGMLLFRFMEMDFIRNFPLFWNLQNSVGWLAQGDYYISNVACYPGSRNKGIGTILLQRGEKEAVKEGAVRMALDVETDNVKAIRLYGKLGYHIAKKSSAIITGQRFEFFRMNKVLK